MALDWLVLAVLFGVSGLQDSCYAIEMACIAHDRPWWAAAADFMAMLINRGTAAAVAVLFVQQGISATALGSVVVAALGGACGTGSGQILARQLERKYGKSVRHRWS